MSYDPDHRVPCCKKGCYATINLSPKDYERLKRTGEWFYCPAGHAQHFTGKTEDQRMIDRLRKHRDEYAERAAVAEAQRDKALDLVRTCPVCQARPPRQLRIYRDPFRFDDDLAAVREWMIEHVQTEHARAELPRRSR